MSARWMLRAAAAEARARGGVALGAATLGLVDAAAAWLSPTFDAAAAGLPLLQRVGPGQRALSALLLLLLALRAVDGLSPEARTGDPLAALPVARGRARAARLLACALVLAAAPLVRHACAATHALVVGPAPDAGAWGADALLDAGQLPLLLAAALVARTIVGASLAWPVLGAGALALALAARSAPPAPWLDVLRLQPPAGAGAALAVAVGWSLAAGLAAAAALGAATSAALTRGRALFDAPFCPHSLGRGNARLAGSLGALLVFAIPLCASAARGPRGGPDAAAAEEISIRTRRYRFIYPASFTGPARALVLRADAIHDAVAHLLGAPVADSDAPIELRLDAPGALAPGADPCGVVSLDDTSAPALAHATCHALLRRVCGALDRETTWVLEEGLAQHAAWRATDGDPFWSRFTAAVLHSRRPFNEDEHLSTSSLERARGREAASVLGEAMIEALHGLGGDGVVPRLMTALARHGRSRAPDLEASRARWDDLLAAAGTDAAHLREGLLVVVEDSAPADPRSQLDLPRLLLVEEVQDSTDLKLVAVPDRPLLPDWDVVCRLIVDPDTPAHTVEVAVAAVRLGPDGTGCWAFSRHDESVSYLPGMGPRPRVQLGLRPLRAGPLACTIWEDWVQLPFTP